MNTSDEFEISSVLLRRERNIFSTGRMEAANDFDQPSNSF